MLSSSQRERLFKKIDESEGLGYVVDIIPAAEISAKMLQPVPTNLNRIAIESTFKIIKEVLELGIQIKQVNWEILSLHWVFQVYVDTLGKPESHQLKLKREFPDLEFTVKAKADALYPIVSMASIVAKVMKSISIFW